MSLWDYNGYDGTNDAQFSMPTEPAFEQRMQLPQNNYTPLQSSSPNISYGTSAPQQQQTQAPNQQYYDAPLNFNQTQQPGMFERLTSGQRGVDNMFRAGQVGVSGIGAFLADRDARRANNQRTNAANTLLSQINPNAQMWGAQINDMIQRPADFLNNPLDVQMSQQAEEAARRTNQLQGRGGLNADQMLNVQGVRQRSSDNRLKSLIDLYGRAEQNNSGIRQTAANIMSTAPATSSSAQLGFLQDLYTQGRGAAADAGYASPVRQNPSIQMTPQQAARFSAIMS